MLVPTPNAPAGGSTCACATAFLVHDPPPPGLCVNLPSHILYTAAQVIQTNQCLLYPPLMHPQPLPGGKPCT